MIKEAAKALSVEAYVLRYWEDELGLSIKRNAMGHRYYDERDIKMFEEIKMLKQKGLTLKDIRTAIEKYRVEGKKEKSEEEKTNKSGDDGELNMTESNIGKENINQTEKRNSVELDKGKASEIKVVDFKQVQLQTIMNKIVANALRENKDIITSSIKAEITTDVMRQFDVVMREKEEREEARYRKLDQVLREMQQGNCEVAATKAKKGLFRKKKR